MKIEEQVLSIEQMKYLQELGVDTSDASMCWLDFEDNEPMEVAVFIPEVMIGYAQCKLYPTYTIGDLLEKLPKNINSLDYTRLVIEGKENSYWWVAYKDLYEYAESGYFNSKSLLTALYDSLCWVAENHKELLEVKK